MLSLPYRFDGTHSDAVEPLFFIPKPGKWGVEAEGAEGEGGKEWKIP